MKTGTCTYMDGYADAICFHAEVSGRHVGVVVMADTIHKIAEALKHTDSVGHASWHAQNPKAAMPCSCCTRQSKPLGFAAAVREYGDDWVHRGFAWNGESYRGLSPHTVIAMQDSRGPDDEDYYRMKRCFAHGRDYQL